MFRRRLPREAQLQLSHLIYLQSSGRWRVIHAEIALDLFGERYSAPLVSPHPLYPIKNGQITPIL